MELHIADVFESGVVITVFPDQEAYDVQVPGGNTYPNCVFGAGFASSLLGFKARGRLSIGTRVTILKANPAIIVACHGSVPPDHKSQNLFRTTTDQDTSIQTQFGEPELGEGSNMGSRLPVDLLEGEFAIDNILAVGVHFLTTLAKLQAGDRAKVEVSLVDDLVRIVSGTFKHHSSMGDFQIYNDGRLNARWDLTSYPHEADGVKEAKDKKATTNSSVVGAAAVAETGRWRFSQFLGHLGDFMHVFITDPVQGLAELAQDRAGKLHVHAGQDGKLVVRSVADIVFERVSRIVVPQEIKEYHHPDGTTAAEYQVPSAEHLDAWRFDPAKPWQTAYHLREYARWLACHDSYARFLQNTKDWEVGPESTAPVPSYGNQEQDRENKLPTVAKAVRETYATFRLMRDGSYVVLDGYGSSFLMAGGDISCSAARHLRLEAGGNISLLAGKSIFLKAQKHVEIVAVLGALLLKARTRLHSLCEKGTILIKSLMTRSEGTDDEHRFADNKVGIVIATKEAGVLVSSSDNLTLEASSKNTAETVKGVIVQATTGDVVMRTTEDGKLVMRTGQLLQHAVSSFIHTTKSWGLITPYFNFCDVFLRSSGKLYARSLTVASGIKTRFITSATKLTGVAPPGGKSVPPHHNHVGYLEDADELNFPDNPSGFQEGRETLGKVPGAPATPQADRVRPIFSFLDADQYRSADPTKLYDQSLAQQIATTAATHPAGLAYQDWVFADDALVGEASSGNDTPFPGKEARMFEYPAEASLHTIGTDEPGDIAATPTKATATAFTFRACTEV